MLLNLALGVGIAIGYLAWGREVRSLERELAASRQRGFIIGAVGVDQELSAQGVVRAVLPEIGVVVLTHDEIKGYMAPMTMGFRAREAKLLDGLVPGDVIRFTLRGVPPNLEITAVSRIGKT